MNTFLRPTGLVMRRALVQLPRVPAAFIIGLVPPLAQFLLFGSLFGDVPKQYPNFPVTNYYTYVAPALVLFVAVIGMAGSGIAFVNDFHTRYINKMLLAPIHRTSILLGRLLSDALRIFVQAGLLLSVTFLLGTSVATGLPGALLILALATLFGVFFVGLIVTNIAIRAKEAESVTAILPMFFIILFLTTAYLPKSAIGNDVLRHIVDFNPAQYPLQAMQSLMFSGWDGGLLLQAFGVIAVLAAVGVPLTAWHFRRSTTM